MRKIYKLFLFLILLFPCFVNAKSNYNNSIKIANNYLETKYSAYSYQRYFKYGGNIPFIYEQGILKKNNSFKNGSFISETEFALSLKNNMHISYLNNGLDYWTLTANPLVGTDNFCVSSDGNYNSAGGRVVGTISKNREESTGIKVTEFINSGVKVTGSGSFGNPYVFSEGYVVSIGSKSPEYGRVNNPTQYVSKGNNANIKYSPMPGYEYSSNNCQSESGVSLVSISGKNEFMITNVSKDISCLIDFDLKAYKIVLDDPKGTGVTPNPLYVRYKNAAYSDSELKNRITSISKKPTMTGYIFNGYYVLSTLLIDKNGNIKDTLYNLAYESEYKNESSVYKEENGVDVVTAKANFIPIKYNINYDANGGSGVMSNTECIYDSNCAVSGNGFTRQNYDFVGWSTNKDATTAEYVYGNSVKNLRSTNNAVVTLYAIWKRQVEIKYDANGGTGAPSSQFYTHSSSGTIKLSSSAPTRNYYKFLGWSTNKSSTKAEYAAGASYSKTNFDNVTLYAVWEEVLTKKTMTFNNYTFSVGAKSSGSNNQSLGACAGKVRKAKVTKFVVRGEFSGRKGYSDRDARFEVFAGSVKLASYNPYLSGSGDHDILSNALVSTDPVVFDTNNSIDKIYLYLHNTASALGTFSGAITATVDYWVHGC